MKRMKKLLTGLLTLGMILSMMTMTAFAAEGGATGTTIDTSKAVSLTIHKYEYNGIDTSNKGTGSETDTDTVPDDAKLLSGVQFTIWKVADLADYYGEDGAVLPKVKDFELTGKGDAAELKKKGSATPFSGKISKETVNGVITFDGPKVTQGLYYVSETNAPANVTGKTDDFLVSLPMTNVEGNDWIYDVHVFPKNKTTYGGVTLVKKGKEGTKAAVSLEGAEFILQMKDKEATAKWDYLKYDDSSTSAKWTYTGVAPTDATKFKTDSNGQINVKDLTAGTYRFIEVSAPNGYIMDGTKKYQFTINNAGKVTWEEDANVGGIGTTTSEGATYSAIVTITNEKPDTEKFVMDRTKKDWEADADYRVGTEVPYLIRVDVPSNVEKLKTFKLTDTMTNLTFKDGSFKIYKEKKSAYTVTDEIPLGITPAFSTDKKTWTIDFNTVNTTTGTIISAVKEYKGKSFYIYFVATLDEGAKMTSDGNPNNITLDYSNAIYPTGDPSNPNNGKDPKVDYIKDVVNVFTFGINVTKKDGETGAVLNDVEFDLYRVNDGVTLPVSPDKVTEEWLKKAENAKKIGSGKTKDQGELSFNGLDNATYYLVETKTKAGYNLLKEPYKAVLNLTATFTKETTKKITTENGTVTTETETTTTYGTGDGATNGKYVVTVKNYKGFTLPTTGGIGTFVFTFAGIAMMAAAVILLITGKKKKAE